MKKLLVVIVMAGFTGAAYAQTAMEQLRVIAGPETVVSIPAFERTDKEKVLESLMTTHRQGQITEIRLRFQGKLDEAEKIRQSNAYLSTEIDTLIGQMMNGWLGDADRTIATKAQNGDLLRARDEIKKLIENLEKLANDETLSDKTRMELFKNLSSARVALQAIEAVLAQSDLSGNLNQRIGEAMFVQKVMASYFAEKTIFGYTLKRGPISIDASGAFYLAMANKLPFLAGAVGGVVTIRPGEAIVTQFNSLKAEFYGTLLEAAHIDKTDSRLKGLVSWGRDTKVVYPGQEFGEPILTGSEYASFR